MERRMQLNGRLVRPNPTMRYYAQRAAAEGKLARLWTGMARYEDAPAQSGDHAKRAAHFGLEALKPLWSYEEFKAKGRVS